MKIADALEAEGLALAAAYAAAERAWVAWVSRAYASPCITILGLAEDLFVLDHPCPEAEAAWLDERLRRHCLMHAAWDDLHDHVMFHGPVETPTGIYKIDGGGNLRFRRDPHFPFGAAPSAN